MSFLFALEDSVGIVGWPQSQIFSALKAIFLFVKHIQHLNPTWVIAVFAVMQWLVQRNNLRLGLYNRRFEVYSSFLALKIWLDRHDGGDESKRESKDVNARYLKAFREARFLFDPRDSIQDLLDEAWKIALREFAWRNKCRLMKDQEARQPLGDAECSMLIKELREHELDSARLEEISDIIEEVLEKYLGFGRIRTKAGLL